MPKYYVSFEGTLAVDADDEDTAEFFAKDQLEEILGTTEIVEVTLANASD